MPTVCLEQLGDHAVATGHDDFLKTLNFMTDFGFGIIFRMP